MKSRPYRSPREILARRIEAQGPRGLARFGMVFIVVLVLAYHLVFGDRGVVRLMSQKSEIRQLEAESLVLEEENSRLESDLVRLRKNPGELEVRARHVLGQVAQGEKIYRFVPVEDTNLLED